MDVDQYLEALWGHEEMSRFEDDELRVIVEACDEVMLQPKQPLWVSEQVRHSAYILVSGRIERSTKTHSGRLTKQYSAPGILLSLSALVKPWPYHSTAYAVDRTELLSLSRANFQQMFEDREPAAYAMVDAIGEYLVGDMRKANARLQEVFGHPAETLMMLRRRIREDSKA